MSDDRQCAASNEDLRRGALEHYERLSKEACSWHSVIPRAINFYFDRQAAPSDGLPPVFQILVDWERENGTLAAIMHHEYEALCQRLAEASVKESPRQAAEALRALLQEVEAKREEAERLAAIGRAAQSYRQKSGI